MLRRGRLLGVLGLVALLAGAMVGVPAPGAVGAQADPAAAMAAPTDPIATAAAQLEPLEAVTAQQPRPGPPALPLAEARAIVDGAVGRARARNQALAVAVLDTGGHIISQDRMDGASFQAPQFAAGKAMAAVMLRLPTADLFDWPTTQPDRWFGLHFNFPGQIYTGPGGVPLSVNGVLVGAAGVSGLPRGEDDEAIEEGIAAWARMRPGAGH